MKKLKTEVVRFRATETELKSLDGKIKHFNDSTKALKPLNRNLVLQSLVRNFSGLGPSFFLDEIAAVKESNRHLLAIGRNLNQVVKRIHCGEMTADHLTLRYLDDITARIDRNRSSLDRLIEHSQKRGQSEFFMGDDHEHN